MISDEMRELLSAYVDGELPHADAARVEDTAKRDPRLRRQILAYRRLRDTLQVWDAEENSVEPSGGVRLRALASVHAYVAERDSAQRARRLSWFQQGWFQSSRALAAGVLIAVSAGVLTSMIDGSTETTTVAARTNPLPMQPIAPLPDFSAPIDTGSTEWSGGAVEHWAAGALDDVIRNQTQGVLVEQDGELVRWSKRALDADRFIRNLDKLSDGSSGGRSALEDETITSVPRHPLVASWLSGGEARRIPNEGVVALRFGVTEGVIPDARPVPARTDKASDLVQGGELNELHDMRVKDEGAPVMPLAGELLVEPVGGGNALEFRRARVVTATTWVKRGELVPMAWANATAADASSREQWAFRAEAFVLGPQARRVLLNKSGRDEALLDWITTTYGSEGVVNAARASVRKHKATLDRMVHALERDARATGFAVYDQNNRVLGTELFATHALMVQFAPRVLSGYLLEAGDRVRVNKQNGGAAEIEAMALKFLADDLPRQVKSVVESRNAQTTDDWPKEMRQVNLQTPGRQVVGHGLLIGNQPLHLSLFGE